MAKNEGGVPMGSGKKGGDPENLAASLLHHREKRMTPGASIGPPIVPASTYFLPGEPDADDQYGRWTNPTWSATEEALGIIEDAECVLFPSGMAAIAAVLSTQAGPGDRVLIPADGYYTTRLFAESHLVPNGVKVEPVATAGLERVDFGGVKLVFAETPSNPGLDLCDLETVVGNARAAGAKVVVDNTFMTPFGQRPLETGADIVVTSDTKASNGHSDLLMGHVATRDKGMLEAILDWRKVSGGIPGQFEAWLLHRGLKTLELRFDRMCGTAQVIAERLQGHPGVESVLYPGLQSHPGHALAVKQMLRPGSIIGLELADAATAESFIADADYILPATSFGGVHTSAERRTRWGDDVPEGFIRLSVGIEPAEALWADISSSLSSAAK